MERKNTIKSRQLLFQDFVFNVLCMINCTHMLFWSPEWLDTTSQGLYCLYRVALCIGGNRAQLHGSFASL